MAHSVAAQTEDVRAAQERLAQLGYSIGPVDGHWGRRTQEALAAFQASRGLRVTGVLDPLTLGVLLAQPDAGTNVLPRDLQPLRAPDVAEAPPQRVQPSTGASQPAAPEGLPPRTPPRVEISMEFWVLLAGLAFAILMFWRSRRRRPGQRYMNPPTKHPPTQPVVAQHPVTAPAVSVSPAIVEGSIEGRAKVARWIPPGQSATIAGMPIGGMVYVGKGLIGQRSHEPEHCLINPDLPVAPTASDIEGQALPYWPSYTRITPEQRRTYLEWLAEGRSDAKLGIGYVFLYFYGLERRLFLDETSAQERAELLAEVVRLQAIYASNSSFSAYAAEVLQAAAILDLDHASPQPLFEWRGWELPLSVRLGIGTLLASGAPICADWLLSWWMCHPETRLRTPARRALPELRQLFAIRFAERYPQGLSVRSPKRALTHAYRAASGTFERDFRKELGRYPDIGGLSQPLSAIGEVATKCIDELDAFSRYLGRNPSGRGTMEAHALLPEPLAASLPNRELDTLRTWVDSRIAADGGRVPLDRLLERIEGVRPTRLSRRALGNAARVLGRIGLGLAPDLQFLLRALRVDESIIVFRLPEGAAHDEESPEYPAALLAATLGVFVALSDGAISADERSRLEAHVEKLATLSATAKARLRANIDWLAANPPQLGQLRSALGEIPEAGKHALGTLAIAVAGADGQVGPGEVTAIQKLYGTMGLPADGIYADLHKLAAPPACEPVVVRLSTDGGNGFTIPSAPGKSSEPSHPRVRLDQQLIARIVEDTIRVSTVLNAALSAEDEEEEELGDDARENARASQFEGLDSAHSAFLLELVSRRAWQPGEFTQLAQRYRLLAGGASEAINEWSFEQFGNILIEEEGDMLLNPEVVDQLLAHREAVRT